MSESAAPESPSFRLPQRAVSLVFFAVQGAVSGLSFLCWALTSHVLTPAQQVPAATALGWGMVVYLPLTLGLPYLLPNVYRRTDDVSVGLRGQLTRTLFAIACVTSVVALIVSVAAIVSGGSTPFGLALSLASAIVLAITLQQHARIHQRLGLMFISVLANLLLPVGWLLAVLATRDVAPATAITSAVFLLYALLAPRALTGLPSASAGRAALVDAARRSLPLVPHLLAFGMIAQGVRFTTALYSHSEGQLLQAHFVMTFLSMGLTVVSGVQGIVSVDVQLASDRDLAQKFRRSAFALGLVAVISTTVVLAVYASPLRGLFQGAAQPDALLMVALALPIPLQCAYFAMNNLFLRAERTMELAGVSTLTAVVFVGVEVTLQPASLDAALLLYDGALALLPLLLLALLMRRGAHVPEDSR